MRCFLKLWTDGQRADDRQMTETAISYNISSPGAFHSAELKKKKPVFFSLTLPSRFIIQNQK